MKRAGLARTPNGRLTRAPANTAEMFVQGSARHDKGEDSYAAQSL